MNGTHGRMWISVCSMLQMAFGAVAGDWPQWRGPDRNGVAPGEIALAETWGPTGPIRLWVSEMVPKDSMGSPVVAGGRVYIYGTSKSATNHEGEDAFFCFDAADGKTLWKQTFPGNTNASSGTPCIAGGRLYCLGSAGTVYCLNAQDGKRIWAVQGKGIPSTKWGETMSSSALVLGDKVIAVAGPLTAFKSDTGEILWTQNKVGPAENSPAVWKTGDRSLLICNTAKDCLCVDPKDGSILWSTAGGMFSSATVAGDNMVLFADNAKVGLAAYRLSLNKAEQTWTLPLRDRGSCPLVYGDHVYAMAGTKVVCVELATGKMAWESDAVGKVEISSPLIAGGRLIAMTGKAGLAMFGTAPQKAELLAQAKLEAGIVMCSSPAFAEGKLYLNSGKKGVACYDLQVQPR